MQVWLKTFINGKCFNFFCHPCILEVFPCTKLTPHQVCCHLLTGVWDCHCFCCVISPLFFLRFCFALKFFGKYAFWQIAREGLGEDGSFKLRKMNDSIIIKLYKLHVSIMTIKGSVYKLPILIHTFKLENSYNIS